MTDEFRSLDLHASLVQAVAELGYTEPTPIQSVIIPIMLSGRDVIGQSQTGSGKTAAFSLPILQTLDLGEDHVPGKVQSLILTPTRELAMQVARAIYGYGQHRNARVLAIYGGQPYSRQIRRLRKGVDIVVGTPGRLLDLIQKKSAGPERGPRPRPGRSGRDVEHGLYRGHRDHSCKRPRSTPDGPLLRHRPAGHPPPGRQVHARSPVRSRSDPSS